MCKAIGVDLYNQCLTGKVAKTLNAIKSDADHVPCVITNATSLEVFHCMAIATNIISDSRNMETR